MSIYRTSQQGDETDDKATSGVLDRRNFVAKEFNAREIRSSVARFESLYSSTCLSQTLLTRIMASLSNSLAQSSSLSSFFTSKTFEYFSRFVNLSLDFIGIVDCPMPRMWINLFGGWSHRTPSLPDRLRHRSPLKMLWFPWRSARPPQSMRFGCHITSYLTVLKYLNFNLMLWQVRCSMVPLNTQLLPRFLRTAASLTPHDDGFHLTFFSRIHNRRFPPS